MRVFALQGFAFANDESRPLCDRLNNFTTENTKFTEKIFKNLCVLPWHRPPGQVCDLRGGKTFSLSWDCPLQYPYPSKEDLVAVPEEQPPFSF